MDIMDTTTEPDATSTVYARFFEDNKNWAPNEQHNELFLRAQENWVNDMLRARGHVFINDVYAALGIDRTQYGQLHGWKKGPIEFKIARQKVSGRIWIELNHEGNILDALPEF